MEPTGNFANNENGCAEWWPLLSAHADGETDAGEAREVETHIARCADCARELAGLKRFSAALGGLTPIEPPLALHSAIMADTVYRLGLAARIRNAFRVPQVQWAGLAAAGAAAALLYSFFQPTLRVEPAHVANRTLSGAQRPVIAHNEKPKPAPIAVKPSNDIPVPAPERELVSIPPAVQPERKHATPARVLVSSQASTPAIASAFKTARLPAPTPHLNESKPNSSLAPSATDDAQIVMAETTRMMGDADRAGDTDSPAAPTPVTTPQPAHIQLVAMNGGIPPGQIATLAGLKKELQSQKLSWNDHSVKESLRDKQLRVDVIRGSF